MLDDAARSNRDRREDRARARVSMLGDVTGKDVLCLASGGGQQSVAFALLGLGAVVNGLIARGFRIDGLWEKGSDEPTPSPERGST